MLSRVPTDTHITLWESSLWSHSKYQYIRIWDRTCCPNRHFHRSVMQQSWNCLNAIIKAGLRNGTEGHLPSRGPAPGARLLTRLFTALYYRALLSRNLANNCRRMSPELLTQNAKFYLYNARNSISAGSSAPDHLHIRGFWGKEKDGVQRQGKKMRRVEEKGREESGE